MANAWGKKGKVWFERESNRTGKKNIENTEYKLENRNGKWQGIHWKEVASVGEREMEKAQ